VKRLANIPIALGALLRRCLPFSVKPSFLSPSFVLISEARRLRSVATPRSALPTEMRIKCSLP